MLDEFTHVLGDLRGQVSQVSDDEFEKGMEMSDRANPWIWTGSKKPQPVPQTMVSDIAHHPPTSLKGLLQGVLVQDIAFLNWLRKRPVLISQKHSIERALYKIGAHDLRALPIVDNNGEIFGIVDVDDIAKPLITTLREDPLTGIVRINSDVMGRSVSSLFLQQNKKTHLLGNKVSLWRVMNHMANYDIRRFLVVDRDIAEEVREQTFPENKIDGVFSQTDIFRFLANNPAWMRSEPLFQKTLSELSLGHTRPLIISTREYAANAFALMSERKRGHAAIVDNRGVLVSTLSDFDLKGINRKNSYVLNLSLEKFYEHDKKKPWWEKPSVVDPQISLYEAIMQFNCTRRHVLYFLDKDRKPVGEITYKEVLRKILSL
jgi:CBS domain-containing protein